MIPSAADLQGRTITIAPEFRDHSPRKPHTHGWLALEVLRRAPGGSLSFDAYGQALFTPEREISDLVRSIPRQPSAYQHFKHIRCDIFRRHVRVDPPLSPEWYQVQRCSAGTHPARP